MSGMQENRKKSKKKSQLCRVPALCKAGHFSQQSPALPSAGVALGKVTKPLPSASTRQRIFQKKCRVPDTSALGEEFFKKKKSFAECLTRRHSAKGGVKLTAPVTFAECWCGTRQILCRVPATWHSTKIPLPTTSLPSGLCREPHSAKPLPTAKVPLPSASGTRQRRRIQ